MFRSFRRLRSVPRIFLRVQVASDSGEPPVQPAMPRLNTYFKMGLIVIFEESPPIVEPQGEGEVFNIVVLVVSHVLAAADKAHGSESLSASFSNLHPDRR